MVTGFYCVTSQTVRGVNYKKALRLPLSPESRGMNFGSGLLIFPIKNPGSVFVVGLPEPIENLLSERGIVRDRHL